jgi:hypothetical protein
VRHNDCDPNSAGHKLLENLPCDPRFQLEEVRAKARNRNHHQGGAMIPRRIEQFRGIAICPRLGPAGS